jgi:TonB family protein
VSTLVDLAVRSSIVLLAGLAVTALLAGRSAALRHWVLAAAIFGAAAVAPLSLALPGWEVAVPVWEVEGPAMLPPAVPSAAPVAPVAPAGALPHVDVSGERAPDRPFVVLVWAAGFAVTAAILMTGVFRLARVASRARRVQDDRWVSITRAVAKVYGLRREVVLLQTDAPYLLATWGVLRPRVLLPSHAREWPEDRIHAVLCHELAHIRRGDWLVQITAQALLTIVWFNPLMWVACARLRRESEQACDDAVLARGVPAREYAGHLLDLARKCRRPEFPWAAAATPMAHPSTLERRIAAMLNPRLNRTALSRRALVFTAVVLLAVTLPTAAFRAAQAPPAALAGTVYDATGAVIPGVALTLEDAQYVKWEATTNSSGRFEFPLIGTGRYMITAALPGFRELRQEFELRSPRDWDRAVTLQVGDLQETITVSERRVPAAAAPSQPRGPRPVRVGGNIRVPRKEYDVRPVYPPAMREAGREGIVPIDAVIGRDGTVTSVRVLSAQVHPDFAMAAVDAVREWRFSPTLLNGSPVEVVMTVSVRFSLSD